MDRKLDQTKSSVKKAVGVPTDDDRLNDEGKLEQVARKVKGKLAQAVETMKAALAAKDPYRSAK